ncbi:MAG: CBS domain-containing protein [Deltaproteobacteria bacterium]|nr:CBS domain-containing protein [Deltaproteobacteria bacterium]
MPDDSILEALEMMMNHGVSFVPVMKDRKVEGTIKLSDVFNEVAALIFDEQDPLERERLLERVRR